MALHCSRIISHSWVMDACVALLSEATRLRGTTCQQFHWTTLVVLCSSCRFQWWSQIFITVFWSLITSSRDRNLLIYSCGVSMNNNCKLKHTVTCWVILSDTKPCKMSTNKFYKSTTNSLYWVLNFSENYMSHATVLKENDSHFLFILSSVLFLMRSACLNCAAAVWFSLPLMLFSDLS